MLAQFAGELLVGDVMPEDAAGGVGGDTGHWLWFPGMCWIECGEVVAELLAVSVPRGGCGWGGEFRGAGWCGGGGGSGEGGIDG